MLISDIDESIKKGSYFESGGIMVDGGNLWSVALELRVLNVGFKREKVRIFLDLTDSE